MRGGYTRLDGLFAQVSAVLAVLPTPLLEPEEPASTLIRRGARPGRVLHALCRLGFLALRLKVATLDEILGDDFGIVHAWGHMRDLGRWPAKPMRAYVSHVKEIERRVREQL